MRHLARRVRSFRLGALLKRSWTWWPAAARARHFESTERRQRLGRSKWCQRGPSEPGADAHSTSGSVIAKSLPENIEPRRSQTCRRSI